MEHYPLSTEVTEFLDNMNQDRSVEGVEGYADR